MEKNTQLENSTRLSSKGQIILPKILRDAKSWEPGLEFTVEEMGEGVFLRPVSRFAETTLDQVAGCLPYQGKAKTLAEMQAAIKLQVVRRFENGKY